MPISFKHTFWIVALSMFTCTTPQKQPKSEEDADDELVFKEDQDVVKSEQFQASSSLKHPKRPDEVTTRALIYSVPQPPQDEIAHCRQDVNFATAEATNQELMKKAVKKVTGFARNQIPTYHWCFYQSMAALDIKLNENRASLQTQADIFVRNMRALWVMAKAMEKLTKNKRYFTYLQIRYKQISQNNFGRSLEETDKLLSSSDSKAYREANKKPASAYQE